MDSQSLAPTAAPSGQGHADIQALTERIVAASAFVDPLRHEVGKVVVGQKGMVDTLLTGLLADGHVLLEGVPGLAKTLAIQTLSRAVNVDFSRIQFTPDLLPADVIGTMIYNQKEEAFSVSKGPIFAHPCSPTRSTGLPPRSRAPCWKPCRNGKSPSARRRSPCPSRSSCWRPRIPSSRRAPIPSPKRRSTGSSSRRSLIPDPEKAKHPAGPSGRGPQASVRAVVKADALLAARELVREVYMDEKVERYIVQLVQATRRPENQGMGHLSPLIGFGASPRATISLALAGKAAPSWPTATT